jgi:prepilin-type N-terminal cleavage/methylation domain-containing protein
MKKNMKKGITLIEIILAIVLIAIILGITIPKLMSNSDRAELKSVISSDIRTIVEAASLWKKESAAAQNSYATVSSAQIASRLPGNMHVDTVSGYIHSGGLRSGNASADATSQETGAQYIVMNDTDGANVENGTISIIVDITRGANDLGWAARTLTYAQDVVTDTMFELTGGATTGETDSASTAVSAPSGSSPASVDCSDANVFCFDNINLQ